MTVRTMRNPRNPSKRSFSESSAEELINKSSGTKIKNGRSKKVSCNEVVVHSSGKKEKTQLISNVADIAIRIVLVIVFIKLETTPSFTRKIQLEELWLYKYPRSSDYVSPRALFLSVVLGPFFATLFYFVKTKNRHDFLASSWVWTLALGLNGLATSLLKITVGRPRPDFYYRCFPDGRLVLNNLTGLVDNGTIELLNCTGNMLDIHEGRKSFPSGHSSFAFAGFGFLAYYAAAKLHVFSTPGRGQTWRLCIFMTPLVFASLVAVSRTCDYHHHWQDVVVGSLIGLFVSYMVYRQYYPSIFKEHCEHPYDGHFIKNPVTAKTTLCNKKEAKAPNIVRWENNKRENCDEDLSSTNGEDNRPLLSIRGANGGSLSNRFNEL